MEHTLITGQKEIPVVEISNDGSLFYGRIRYFSTTVTSLSVFSVS